MTRKKEARLDGKGKYYAFLALGVLSMSSAAPLVKIASTDTGSFSMAFWRLLIASIIIVPFGAPWKMFRDKKALFWSGLSGFFLAMHFAVWISSFRYISVSATAVLVTTAPIFIAMLEYLVWRKKPTPYAILGIFLAIGGAAVIALWGTKMEGTTLGVALSLLGALFGSCYLITSKIAQERAPLLQTVSISYPVASLLLLAGALLASEQLWGYSGASWLSIAGMALFPQVIGHTALNMGVKYLTPIITTTTNLFEPVGASIIAWAFLGDPIGLNVLVGGLLIFAGVVTTGVSNRTYSSGTY